MWEEALPKHPNKQFTNYISQGLKQGFQLGFRHGGSRLSQAHSNMTIADSQVVREYLSNELEEDRLVQMSLAEAEALASTAAP